MIILSEVIIWKSWHLVFMISSERGHSSSPLIEFLSILHKILDLLEYQEPFDNVLLPYITPYPIVCVWWCYENLHTPLSWWRRLTSTLLMTEFCSKSLRASLTVGFTVRCKSACISATRICRRVHRSVNFNMRFSPHLLPKLQPSPDPTLKAKINSPPFPTRASKRTPRILGRSCFEIAKTQLSSSRNASCPHFLASQVKSKILCQLNGSLWPMIQSILAPKLVIPQLLCRLKFRAEPEVKP